jgi:ribonuclease BN (tRNA processing enzyme)
MRRVTVLGSCGAFPEPGRACSGFLVEWDDYRLVLDLGYATLPRLLTYCPDAAVDAVVITHEHPDHCIDLHGLFRMHLYGGTDSRRIPLYCPPGVLDRLAGLEPRRRPPYDLRRSRTAGRLSSRALRTDRHPAAPLRAQCGHPPARLPIRTGLHLRQTTCPTRRNLAGWVSYPSTGTP